MKSLFAAIAVTSALAFAAAASAAPYPSHIDLPNGWAPEGIAAGKGHTLYVGSIPSGRIIEIDARTGETDIVVTPTTSRPAIGLKADQFDRLFVAGGGTGDAFVYDANTGAELASFNFFDGPAGSTFVNDVVLTKDGAFFTDSRRQVLYIVEPDLSGFTTLPLPDITPFDPTANNLNGITATPNGKTLLAIQSNTGILWNIDPESGHAFPVDTGGANLTQGDGILLEGKTLYVVRNRSNQVAVLELSPDFRSATLVDTLFAPPGEFSVPTTIARLGDRLYLPNARFGTPVTPDTPYWVTALER